MRKLQLTKANPGNYSKDKQVFELVKSFNNGLIEITDEKVLIKTKDNKTFSSNLKKTEEDFMSETFQGVYEDGSPFRLVKPGDVAKQIMSIQGQGESISFGGMTGDGYAVHFKIVELTEPDNNDYSESRDTEFTSSTDSKAETLVMTADSLHEFNPKMAQEHISRFMNLLTENDIELVKFEHIQNIVYGFVLAIRLNMIDEDTANEKLSRIKLLFSSKDHIRYENGIHVSGPHGGAGRGIQIVPNFELKDGYLVTIYNQDGLHPVWGNNIQMAPKQMKVVSKTVNKIELRGFGHDKFGNTFSDYGMTLKINDGELEKCILHMHDRNVDIEYLKGEVSQTSDEPEIISLAKRANAQYQQERITDGHQLLVQIYRSVKSDPGQLRNVKDFSVLGTSFLMMLNQNLSDDIDTLQMMASISYLCISKAIEQDSSNLNLYKDRLLMLRIGHDPFKYTVMSALDLNAGVFMPFSMDYSDLEARNAIYKMEIADLELHPQLYRQVQFFKERKDEFDEKIGRQFFMPEKTLDNVIKSGVENHKKLLDYLENRVIKGEDVDF